MKIVLNGTETEIVAHRLDAALSELGYDGLPVATAVNSEFVARAERAATTLVRGRPPRGRLATERRLTCPCSTARRSPRVSCWGRRSIPLPLCSPRRSGAPGAGVATVSVRREAGGSRAGADFWTLIRELGVRVLPNTAGCHTAREAVTTARMARELFDTDWIKLEVIGHADTLQPDPWGLVEAAAMLVDDGFRVFPYTTEDLVLAERLLGAGCEVLMPWGAPIGSGLGLTNDTGCGRSAPGSPTCRW